MRVPLWPRHRLGKTALALASAALLLILVRAVYIRASGLASGGYFFSDPTLEIFNILIWLGASGAFVAGVGALSYRDRSVSVLAGAAFGFAIFLNGVIQMMAPP